MGVLNVTPDSFSDGGRFIDPEATLGHAMRMIEEGASLIDVGGESTRPGAARIDPHEQIARTISVVERLRDTSDVVISIDTTSYVVARAALDHGANVINDVSAGRDDPRLLDLAAERGCGVILMHRLRPPDLDSYSDRYRTPPEYDDVVWTVRDFLAQRVEAATRAGIAREAIAIDPGLGFGKTVEQNFQIVGRVSELHEIGCTILCGASRKSFIGHVTGVEEPRARIIGSTAANVAMYAAGVRLFRVHDVADHREALAVAQAIARTFPEG